MCASDLGGPWVDLSSSKSFSEKLREFQQNSGVRVVRIPPRDGGSRFRTPIPILVDEIGTQSFRSSARFTKEAIASSSVGTLVDVGVDADVFSDNRRKVVEVLLNMAQKEKRHCDQIRIWLREQPLFRFVVEVVKPAEAALMANFDKALDSYLQHAMLLALNLKIAATRANEEYHQGIGQAAIAYRSLPVYLEHNNACVSAFKTAQDVCTKIVAADPRARKILRSTSEDIVRAINEHIVDHKALLEYLLACGEIPEGVFDGLKVAFQQVEQHVICVQNGISLTLGRLCDQIVSEATDERKEVHRVALRVLTKISSGNEDAINAFIYGVGATFGMGELSAIDPYDYLNRMFEAGSPDEQFYILQTLLKHLTTGASLPITVEGVTACKSALKLILTKLPLGRPEIQALASEMIPLLAEKLNVSSNVNVSSSSFSSVVPETLYDQLTKSRIQSDSQAWDICNAKPSRLYRDLRSYLAQTLKEINLSELDHIGRGVFKPTLSAHTTRSTLITQTLAQQILLSKSPKQAFEKVYTVFERAKNDQNFDLATALSGALQLWSVDRLKLGTMKQNDVLLQMAIQSGSQQKGMAAMEEAMKNDLRFFPNMATVCGAVTQIMERPMTQGGVLDEEQVNVRMQTLLKRKKLAEYGIKSIMSSRRLGRNVDDSKIIQIAYINSEIMLRLRIYGDRLAIMEEYLQELSFKIKPLSPASPRN